MHLAATDIFRARWTDRIHDEWMRNLLANRPDLRVEQLQRTRELMNAAVHAQHPDEFIMRLLDVAQPLVIEAVRRHRANLRKPPKTVEEYLDALARQQLPRTVEYLRRLSSLL